MQGYNRRWEITFQNTHCFRFGRLQNGSAKHSKSMYPLYKFLDTSYYVRMNKIDLRVYIRDKRYADVWQSIWTERRLTALQVDVDAIRRSFAPQSMKWLSLVNTTRNTPQSVHKLSHLPVPKTKYKRTKTNRYQKRNFGIKVDSIYKFSFCSVFCNTAVHLV